MRWVNAIILLDDQNVALGVIYGADYTKSSPRVKMPQIDIQDATRMKEIRHPPNLEKVKKAYNHYI